MKEINYNNEVYRSVFEDDDNVFINKDGKVITFNRSKITERKPQYNKSGTECVLVRYKGKYKTIMTKSTAYKLFGLDENLYNDYKDVVGFEGLYKVNKYGDILSLGNGNAFFGVKHLTPVPQSNGYMIVTLHKNKEQFNKKVHRIVAEAFLPNPNNYESINHIDHNKSNNCVDNLEWCTQRYNNIDEHGIKLKIINTINNKENYYTCYVDCAKDLNCSGNAVKYAAINNTLLFGIYKVVLL